MTRKTVSHSRGDGYGTFTRSWAVRSSSQTIVNASADQETGHRWLEQAEGEHASVASFAKNSLHLLSAEAPSDLLLLSQRASLDEIRHAEVCYRFASQFLGDDLEENGWFYAFPSPSPYYLRGVQSYELNSCCSHFSTELVIV